MKIISSAQNQKYKELVQLSKKQSERNKHGKIILEGAHLAKEYLKTYGAPKLCVFTDKSLNNEEAVDIINACEDLGSDLWQIAEGMYSKISPVVNGIGLILVADKPELKDIDYAANSIILENIQDPGNLGTIMRSASAAGIEQIICSRDCVSVYSPKVMRAGMGAHFRLNIIENRDLIEDVSLFEVPVVATSLEADKSIYNEDLRNNIAWIFGNEGAGVSAEILKMADKKVIIPQANDLESLNVAMAATICAFEQMRQKNGN